MDNKEYGLLTLKEFLQERNPEGIYHSSQVYQTTLKSLNEDYSERELGRNVKEKNDFYLWKTDLGYYIKDQSGKLLAVIFQKTAFYDPLRIYPDDIKDFYREQTLRDTVPFKIEVSQFKKVKYPSEYFYLVSNPAKRNIQRFPHLLKKLKIKNEFYDVRLEESPQKNKGITIVFLNEEQLVVAMASNEWGATLLQVAQEYRGKGLGVPLGKIWYAMNPNFTSGGFTPSGERNAIKIWQEIVRELLSQGFYSQLLKEGKISKERVKEILKDVPKRKIVEEEKPKEEKKEMMFYTDDSSFIIYDKRFFSEQDDKYIYGFGFFRTSRGKNFLFRIEYDRKFQEVTTYTALQFARDQGFSIYLGSEVGSDLVEFENLSHVEEKDGFVYLTKDALPLKSLSQKEKVFRRQNDRYSEIEYQLLEQANAKWN